MPRKVADTQNRLTEKELSKIQPFKQNERIHAFLKDSHASENAAEYASQRSKRSGGAVEKQEGTHKDLKFDEVSSGSDKLNGKRAKKQRLAGRREQKRRRAAVCKPQPPSASPDESDEEDDRLQGKYKRANVVSDKKPVVQDRSRTKAAQIKNRSRRQKNERAGNKSKSRSFADMLANLKALQPRQARMTIPHLPRQGIFSLGTSSPYEVKVHKQEMPQQDGHCHKKARRAPKTPCDCNHDVETTSSHSTSVVDDGKTERIKALESTVEKLTCIMALQNGASQVQESAKSTASDISWSSTIRRGLPSANLSELKSNDESNDAQWKAKSVVLNIGHMKWATPAARVRSPLTQEEAVLKLDTPQMLSHARTASITFRAGRPDQHPTNGWRSQHKVDEIGVGEMQRRFFAAGGPRFRASSPVQGFEEAKPVYQEAHFAQLQDAHHGHQTGSQEAVCQHQDWQQPVYDYSDREITAHEQSMHDYDAGLAHYDAEAHNCDDDASLWQSRDPPFDERLLHDADEHPYASSAPEWHDEGANKFYVDGLPSFCTISKKDLPALWQPARHF